VQNRHLRGSYSGGAKGIRTPALTRQNTGLPGLSFLFVPVRSRSLPAVAFSGLDGVKSRSGHCMMATDLHQMP
jgi:hypothetical protein